MDRLFNVAVSQLIYEDEHGKATVKFVRSPTVPNSGGTPSAPTSKRLWESKIELGEKFFHEIIHYPVPLDMNILKALKRSSLGPGSLPMGVLPHLHSSKRPLRLSWKKLYRQFGTDPAKASDKRIIKIFRRQALRELKKIKLAWAELNYSTAPGVLILHPSPTSIPPAAAHPKLVS